LSPELVEVVKAWDKLPASLRGLVVAAVREASK
jgi:hypothetical protein